MQLHIKAALLSAFIIPGLGQMYKKDRVKGGIIIFLVNIFLLGALFFVLQGMGQLVLGVKGAGAVDTRQVLESLQGRYPAVRWLLSGFFVLWAYGVADALCAREKE